MVLRCAALSLLVVSQLPLATALLLKDDGSAQRPPASDEAIPAVAGKKQSELLRTRSNGKVRDQLVLDLPPLNPPRPEQLQHLTPLPQPAADSGAGAGPDPGDSNQPGTAAAGDSEHCGKLGASLEEQLEAVLTRRRKEGHESRPLVWTVIDSSYAQWALDQQAQLESAAELPFTVFVAVDLDSSTAQELCRQGLPTIDFSVEFVNDLGGSGAGQLKTIEWTTKYRVAKAKFTMPAYLLKHDVANMFVEGDIFWLRDPTKSFESALAGAAGRQSPIMPPQVPTIKPSLLMPTHHNNPFALNIGLWYVPKGARKELGGAFWLVWELMATFYTDLRSDNPFNFFDQAVFKDVFHDIFGDKDPAYSCENDGNSQTIEPGTDERKRYCETIASHNFEGVAGRLLPNDLIQCDYRITWDDETLAVHVLAGHALSGAQFKLAKAKLQGVFIGRPSYYENLPRPSTARLLAWDGDYQSATLEQGYCKFPLFDAGPCGPATSLPIMATLGQRLRREVVLPQTVDLNTLRRPAETFFDAVHFEQKFGVRFRESSFLYNRRLNTKNMYPIVRLRVTTEGWAAVQKIAMEGSAPTTAFYSVPSSEESQTGGAAIEIANILIALAGLPEVNDAKLVLLRFANKVDMRLDNPDHVTYQVARLQGRYSPQRLSSSFEFKNYSLNYLCKVRLEHPGSNGNGIHEYSSLYNLCGSK